MDVRQYDDRLGVLVQAGGWFLLAVAIPAFLVSILYLIVVVLDAVFLGGGVVLRR